MTTNDPAPLDTADSLLDEAIGALRLSGRIVQKQTALAWPGAEVLPGSLGPLVAGEGKPCCAAAGPIMSRAAKALTANRRCIMFSRKSPTLFMRRHPEFNQRSFDGVFRSGLKSLRRSAPGNGPELGLVLVT